ncbi:ABC transporter ATP-binding protein [Asaia sp. HN010]|uniref:ABC transporter ATP-binding protein n=1 Tax=Asaia sp. HN010 TaxID=3081233 RepID=UPI00301781A6
MAFLSLDSVSFARSGRAVLSDVSLKFRRGELVSILGANGAGKTSLLRLMLGLLRPETGRVLLDGEELRRLSRQHIARLMAYVPQNRDSLPPYSVAQIVGLGRLPYGSLTRGLSRQDLSRVEAALELLDLAGLRDRPCTALSGGEYQRVLLARVLVQDAPVLVLDEPLSGLDYGHQLRLMALLAELAREGRLVLMTAHQPDLVYPHASHVVLIDQGRVLVEGHPETVLDSATLSAFYGVALRHHDYEGKRFFIREERKS